MELISALFDRMGHLPNLMIYPHRDLALSAKSASTKQSNLISDVSFFTMVPLSLVLARYLTIFLTADAYDCFGSCVNLAALLTAKVISGLVFVVCC